MKHHAFHNADGTLLCIINIESVTSAEPIDEEMLLVHTGEREYRISRKEFEKSISGNDSEFSTVCSAVNRLTQAVERLTIHIPTSIRMHM